MLSEEEILKITLKVCGKNERHLEHFTREVGPYDITEVRPTVMTFARAIERAVLERAAQVCDQYAENAAAHQISAYYIDTFNSAKDLAELIRALLPKEES